MNIRTHSRTQNAQPARTASLFPLHPATLGRPSRLLRKGRTPARTGFSLLEVLVSIAILGGAMVMIGQLFNLGARSARQARLRNEANILADTKMAELAAHVIPTMSTANQTIDENPDWSYSVDIQPAEQPGLLVATVVVEQNNTLASPIAISIVRFIPDPDYEPEVGE